MFRPTVLLSCLALLVASSRAEAASEPVRTDHLQSRLVADATAAVPGRTLTLGLLLEHYPHWHTYWRNPGDSGLATDLELVLPAGVVASPIAWPHPERFELAEIVNYGFGGRRLLPVAIAIPAGYAAPTLPVQAKASWLVCEEECIPGKAQYALELPVAATATPDARWSADFAAAPDAGGFGRESVLVFATGMLLLVVAMAFAIRASLRQRALSARSEETDR